MGDLQKQNTLAVFIFLMEYQFCLEGDTLYVIEDWKEPADHKWHTAINVCPFLIKVPENCAILWETFNSAAYCEFHKF